MGMDEKEHGVGGRSMTLPDTDEFLFGRGLQVSDYFIDRKHGPALIGFTNADGRSFDLHVSDPVLHQRALVRLEELGVRVIPQSE